MQWCGLKFFEPLRICRIGRHHWCSGVDWNFAVRSWSSIMSSSPLMQWCGLKFCSQTLILDNVLVTTDAVVWIEIPMVSYLTIPWDVTTDAVVWIEILHKTDKVLILPSPLMQWCGLKCGIENGEGTAFSHHWCSGVDWNISAFPYP